MDGATLSASMSYSGYAAPLSLARYGQLVAPLEVACRQASCNTVNRVSMFLAQIGAESGSLRWTEELADGTAYNGRTDLGNTQPGDGPRFKGRSFIQITGRTHYVNLSKWAHDHGYVPSATYFVDNPTHLAWDQYAFLGPVWYWVVARPQLNSLADKGDINGGTYAVNGGYNNLSGRTSRWNKCRSLGNKILATAPDIMEEIMSYYPDKAAFRADLKAIVMECIGEYTRCIDPATKTWDKGGHQIRTAVVDAAKGLGLDARPGGLKELAANVTAIKVKDGA